ETATRNGPAHLRRALFLLVLAFLAAPPPALADTSPWRMPTEYPASSMPGEGVAAFAEMLAKASGGRLAVAPSFDAALGVTWGGDGAGAPGRPARGGAPFRGPPPLGRHALPPPLASLRCDDARRGRASLPPRPPRLRAGLRPAGGKPSLRDAVAGIGHLE